jgi:mono/diheme cytochrome c family protein
VVRNSSFFQHENNEPEDKGMRPNGVLFSPVWMVLITAVAWSALAYPATKEQEDQAYTLYKVRCALCHYIDRPEAKFAPSLQGLFKKDKLTNGKPVNDQTVADWIADGSQNMPGFRHTLDQKEVELIISYIKGELGKQSSR